MRRRQVNVQTPERMNVLTMLRSESGCRQFQTELKNHINDNPWIPIKPMVDGLESDVILVPLFSTIYTMKESEFLASPPYYCYNYSFRFDL